MFFVTTKGKKVYSEIKYSDFDEVFLLFGKETKGLPEDILKKYINKTIRIPMRETPIVDRMCLVVYSFMVIPDLNFQSRRLFLRYRI